MLPRSRPRLAAVLVPALAFILLVAPATAQVPTAPIGRIAEAAGPVQVRQEGRAWAEIARGTALRDGQSLRTLQRSQAELDLGPNRIGLDPDTVLRIDSAHPAAPAFALEQGRAMFLLRSLQPGQEARVTTPRATISLIRPGLYVVDSGGDGRPATVGVTRGLAQAVAPGISLMVPAGQTGTIGGPDGRPGSLRPGVAEGFLADDPNMPSLPQIVRPAMPPPPAYAPAPDLAELPGGDALLREGQWVAVPEYGQVWYPPVAPGWSPYADPWGDRVAWGYAPWHYGSWVAIGPRWGWLPPPRHHYPSYARGHRPPQHARGHGRPPPAVAQPNRPSPFWGGPPPGGVQRGDRPPPPPGAPPSVSIPRPAPAQAPPSFWGRQQGTPPFAAPRAQAPPPMAAPPPRPAPSAAPPRRCGFFGTPC
jgi:hypothetical protein